MRLQNPALPNSFKFRCNHFIMKRIFYPLLISGVLFVYSITPLVAQKPLVFGVSMNLSKITTDSKEKEKPLQWLNVNTDPDTWTVKDGQLKCTGRPIGVMRSERQFENFILHVEWMHMEPGGNSGVFVWSAARPGEENRLPDGVEVQMLELD